MSYETDIKLGERYMDAQTGIQGTATAVTFYQFGCERVSIEVVDLSRGEIKEYSFDAPRLTSVKTGKVARTKATGGPRRGTSDTRPGAVKR